MTESPSFGVEVLNVDLSDVSLNRKAGIGALLKELLTQHLVLLFRGQDLGIDQLLGATKLFGDVAARDPWSQTQQRYKYPFPDQPRLRVMTGSAPSSTAIRWHIDAPFLPTTIDFLILHAIDTAPSVAPIQFLDMRAAFADFSGAEQARLRKMSVLFTSAPSSDVAVEAYDHRPTSAETSFTRPLVFRHPVTSHESLQISTGRLHRILDMPETESDELISDIYQRATRVRYFLSHSWTTGDVLVWDNYSTNHRQGPAGYGERLIHKFHGCWTAA